MEFKIQVFQNEEGIFAEVLNESGNHVCLGDGKSPYEAVKDVCSVLSDIMTIEEEEENEDILKMIKEREKNDDGVRYTIEDVKKMRFKNN